MSPDVFDERIAYARHWGIFTRRNGCRARSMCAMPGSPLPMSFAERKLPPRGGAGHIGRWQAAIYREVAPYHPLVSLLSVPSGEAVSPGEVLSY